MKTRRIGAFLLLLLIAGGIYAAAQTESVKKDVIVNEQTIAGNAAAADGLSASFGWYLSYGGLSWEHEYTYGGEQSTEFLDEAADGFESGLEGQDGRVELYTNFDFSSAYELFCMDETAEGKNDRGNENIQAEKMLKAPFSDNAEAIFEQIGEKFSANQTKSLKIKVQDLLKYYIINGDIQFAGRYSMLDFWMLKEYIGSSMDAEQQLEMKIWSDIQSFFKIPVLENEYQSVTMVYDPATGELEHTETSESNGEKDDSFQFSTVSCVTDEAAYFTFNPHTQNGKLVDTSLIPGGYGIYRLPFDTKSGVPKTGELKMVYALDPNKEYNGIHASPDGKKLFLTYYINDEINDGTEENAGSSDAEDEISVHIAAELIDTASMSCDKKISVMESTKSQWIDRRDDGEYLLFADGSSQLAVYRYDAEKESYEEFLRLDGLDFDLPDLSALTDSRTKMYCEDGRIAFASYEYVFYEEDEYIYWRYTGCVAAAVNVFTKDGHVYCGRLYSNLQDYYDRESRKKIGDLLSKETEHGKTFITDSKFRSYMQESYQSLGVKRAE